jgi:hypothetical protein
MKFTYILRILYAVLMVSSYPLLQPQLAAAQTQQEQPSQNEAQKQPTANSEVLASPKTGESLPQTPVLPQKPTISNLRELEPLKCMQPYVYCRRAFDYVSPDGVAELVIEYRPPNTRPPTVFKIKRDEPQGTITYRTYVYERSPDRPYIRDIYIRDKKGEKSNYLMLRTDLH